MVEPEIVQLFGQLPVAFDRAEQLRFQEIVRHHLLRGVQKKDGPPDLRRRGVEKLLPLRARHGDQHFLHLAGRHGFQQLAFFVRSAGAQRLQLFWLQNLIEFVDRFQVRRVFVRLQSLFCFVPGNQPLDSCAQNRIVGQRLLSVGDGFDQLRRRIALHCFHRSHAQRFQRL